MTTPSLFSIDTIPFAYEQELWKQGLRLIAGVDEVGRGALAGPVVAAAVILSVRGADLIGQVRDSKKLSPQRREELFPLIEERAIAIAVASVQPEEIDQINILQASLKAMALAVEQLRPAPDLCLIDGNAKAPLTIPQRTIVKGDDRVLSIGAASIIAKVTRDRMMREMDAHYPGYGFAQHKGYGTEFHFRAIEQQGPSPQHRRSFCHSLRLVG